MCGCAPMNRANTYFDVVLILNDECCVELRIRILAPPVVDGGTIVIGKEDGSLIMLSIESGSSSMVLDRVGSFSFRRRTTSSFIRAGDFFVVDNSFLTNARPSWLTAGVVLVLCFAPVFVDDDVA